MLDILHSVYQRLPRPPSTNFRTGQYSYNLIDMLPTSATIVDVGAKDAKGKTAAKWHGRYISLDIAFSPELDVVGDAHALPFKTGSVDAVFCVSVLMHCYQPCQVLSEILRVLKPGGLVYISTSFVYRTAADPVDYYRFLATGLQRLCEGFEPIQTGFNRGPASSMADMLPEFLAIVFCFNSRNLYSILRDVFRWALYWVKYLDLILNRYKMAHVIHNGSFFFGKKPLG